MEVRGQKDEEQGASKRSRSDADADADADADDGSSVRGSRLTLNPCISRDVMRAPCTCKMRKSANMELNTFEGVQGSEFCICGGHSRTARQQLVYRGAAAG